MAQLAKAWRTLLSKKDNELGIDTEYTRPGIEALLGKFANALSDVERLDECGYDFRWKE